MILHTLEIGYHFLINEDVNSSLFSVCIQDLCLDKLLRQTQERSGLMLIHLHHLLGVNNPYSMTKLFLWIVTYLLQCFLFFHFSIVLSFCIFIPIIKEHFLENWLYACLDMYQLFVVTSLGFLKYLHWPIIDTTQLRPMDVCNT